MQPDTSIGNGCAALRLEDLIERLSEVRAEMAAMEQEFGPEIDCLHDGHRTSAKNLLHYLALRRHDLRQLQVNLASYGLSSLGRSESQVAANLDAVLNALCCLARRPVRDCDQDPSGFIAGKALLENNTAALLGPAPQGRRVRIMVTMPREAASDYALVRDLLKSGMNCMRVNAAHDNEDAWASMVENLRRAQRELGQSCTVLMDLPGPKLRTGPTALMPGVLKLQPKRDRFGNVMEAAHICLTAIENPEADSAEADATVCVRRNGCLLSSPDKGSNFSTRAARHGR